MELMKWITLWLMLSHLSVSLIELKKGAILKTYGRVKMVNDITIIKINLKDIVNQQEQLLELNKEIEAVLERNETIPQTELLKRLHDEISNMFFNKVNKRSLLPFIGTAMNTLFGVATDSDLEKNKEKIDKLESWAAERGTIINKVIDATNKNQVLIQILKNFVDSVNENITLAINELKRAEFVNQLLFESESFLVEYKELMNAIMMACKGILSPYFVTPSELESIIQMCILEHQFKPLVNNIIPYYDLITVKIVLDHIILIVPFNNNEENVLFSIHPFPMLVNNRSIILKGDIQHFALQQNSLLLVMIDDKSFNECIMLQEQEFVCNIQSFYEPLSRLHCMDDLINNRNGENRCNYVEFNYDFQAQILYGELLVFSHNPVTAKITCRNNQSQFTFTNLKSFLTSCQITILNYLYYNPTVFATYSLNLTYHISHFEVVKEFQLSKLELESFSKLEHVNQFFYIYKT